MALNPTPSSNSSQLRNVLLIGIVIGAVVALILSAVVRGDSVSKKDLNDINDKLAAIEAKLDTPAPTPQPSGSPSGSLTVAAVNDDPDKYVGQSVELSGRVSSPHQGVGFVLMDPNGTFIWVHTKDKIPSGTATVSGKITTLKDQLNQWKNEDGWPESDATLTAKLREEKVFLEADSVK